MKRIALLTALWTAGNMAATAGFNQFTSFATLPQTAYAATSEEERALQRAEQDLIEAQHRVIEAQRALLEKQKRLLENREGESTVPAARGRRETAPVKQRKESYETPPSERPVVRHEEPQTIQRNETPVIRHEEPQRVQRSEPPVIRHEEPQTIQRNEPPADFQMQKQQERQAISIPRTPSDANANGYRQNANQNVLNDDGFANAVWQDNNGGVVANQQTGETITENTKASSLLSGWTAADLDTLRKQNNGILAAEEKMIYTTDSSVMFTFTGMARKKSVDSVLNALRQVNGKGTFFVTERELKRNQDVIREIVAAGQELGICIYPKPEEGFGDVCADILRVKQILKNQYGKDSNLVKQFSGAVRDVTKEAVSALGCRLIGANMNAVQSRHQDYQTAEQILPEIMGKAVFSLGRGWIVNIRMDFYKKPDLAAELLLYLKRKKIDNIAYNSFDDMADVNPVPSRLPSLVPTEPERAVSARHWSMNWANVTLVKERSMPMTEVWALQKKISPSLI